RCCADRAGGCAAGGGPVSADLKPCPFCGGPAEVWRRSHDLPRRRAWVGCMGRCTVLVSREHETDAEAIAAWNTRAPDAEAATLRAQRDALAEALGEAEEVLALMEHQKRPDPAFHDRVKALGQSIGFGAMMATAEAGWRETLEEHGMSGCEHV